MPRITINDETHEISLDDIELDENQLIIDKTNPPKGWYTEDAVNTLVKQNVNKTKDRLEKDVIEDKEFHKRVFDQYNITLDNEGNPKGLKPDFDPEEWKSKKAKELTEPLTKENESLKQQNERIKKARIADSILAATKGVYKDEFTTAKDSGRVKPIVVNQFQELFDVDENGIVALKDKDGQGFAIDGSGSKITPDKYLSDQEKFGDLMVDKRQRGTGFQNGSSTGKRIYTRDQIKNMSSKDLEANQDDILKAANEGRITD